jgi:hypothetical protein
VERLIKLVADRGLPIVLTASTAGARLYARLGFGHVDEVVWGIRGRILRREPVMVLGTSEQPAAAQISPTTETPSLQDLTSPDTTASSQLEVQPATLADVLAMANLQTLVIQVNAPSFEVLWPPAQVPDQAVNDFYVRMYTNSIADPSVVIVKATLDGELVGLGRAVSIGAESLRTSPAVVSNGDLGPVGCDVEICRAIARDGVSGALESRCRR